MKSLPKLVLLAIGLLGDFTAGFPENVPSKGEGEEFTGGSTSGCLRKHGLTSPSTKTSLPRIDQLLEYSVAQNIGQTALGDINNRISTNQAKDTFPSADAGYDFGPTENPPEIVTSDYRNIWEDPDVKRLSSGPSHNFDNIFIYKEWVSKTKPPPLGDGFTPEEKASQNFIVNGQQINTKEGIIVAQFRDQDADGNVIRCKTGGSPAYGPNAVRSHELSWQGWIRQVHDDGGDVKNLKVLVAEKIQGEGAKSVLTRALSDTQQSPNSKATFVRNPNDSTMTTAFEAIAGTDNVKPFIQMIAQNHKDLGNKIVTKILVFPGDSISGRTRGAANIVLILGPSS